MPLIYSVSFYFLALDYPNNVDEPKRPPTYLLVVYLLSSYSRGILLLISAIFLSDAMRRIKQIIQSTDP